MKLIKWLFVTILIVLLLGTLYNNFISTRTELNENLLIGNTVNDEVSLSSISKAKTLIEKSSPKESNYIVTIKCHSDLSYSSGVVYLKIEEKDVELRDIDLMKFNHLYDKLFNKSPLYRLVRWYKLGSSKIYSAYVVSDKVNCKLLEFI